jgi:hypothetical protein
MSWWPMWSKSSLDVGSRARGNDGRPGLELAVQERPDLIVLDIPPEPLYVDGWPQR